MKKFLSSLAAIGCFILFIALILLYYKGAIHAEVVHHEGSLGFWCIPWAIFRGIESFFHNK